MNGYELTRAWFDFAFENPNKITPVHGVLYLFIVEHCNRMGWKERFGLPTTMAKEAIGVRSYNTYKKALEDLVDWGFIIMVERSKNQFSSNIVALSKFDKATDKALDKALMKHGTKQRESTDQSIDSIDKQENLETNKPKTDKGVPPPHFLSPILNDAYLTYLQMRKEKKSTAGKTVIASQVKLLSGLTFEQAMATLKYSTDNGYTGLFPEKFTGQTQKNNQQQPTTRPERSWNLQKQ